MSYTKSHVFLPAAERAGQGVMHFFFSQPVPNYPTWIDHNYRGYLKLMSNSKYDHIIPTGDTLKQILNYKYDHIISTGDTSKPRMEVDASVRPIIGLADNRLDRPGRSWQADYRLKILLIGHRPIVHMIGRLLT